MIKKGYLEKLSEVPILLLENEYVEAMNNCRAALRNSTGVIYNIVSYLFDLAYLYKGIRLEVTNKKEAEMAYKIAAKQMIKTARSFTNIKIYPFGLFVWDVCFGPRFKFPTLKANDQTIQKYSLALRDWLLVEKIKEQACNKVLSRIYCIVAYISYQNQRKAQSISELSRAIELDPIFYEKALGITSIWELIQIDEGRDGFSYLLNQYFEFRNGDINTSFYIAHILFILGEYSEASKYWVLAMKKGFHKYWEYRKRRDMDITYCIAKCYARFSLCLDCWNRNDFKGAERHLTKLKAWVDGRMFYLSHEGKVLKKESRILDNNERLSEGFNYLMEIRALMLDSMYNLSAEKRTLDKEKRIVLEKENLNKGFDFIASILQIDKEIKIFCNVVALEDFCGRAFVLETAAHKIIKDIFSSHIITRRHFWKLDNFIFYIIAKRLYISILFAAIKKKIDPKWSLSSYLVRVFEDFSFPESKLLSLAKELNDNGREIELLSLACKITKGWYDTFELFKAVDPIKSLEGYINNIYKFKTNEEFAENEAILRRNLIPSLDRIGSELTTSSFEIMNKLERLRYQIDDTDSKIMKMPEILLQLIEQQKKTQLKEGEKGGLEDSFMVLTDRGEKPYRELPKMEKEIRTYKIWIDERTDRIWAGKYERRFTEWQKRILIFMLKNNSRVVPLEELESMSPSGFAAPTNVHRWISDIRKKAGWKSQEFIVSVHSVGHRVKAGAKFCLISKREPRQDHVKHSQEVGTKSS